MLCEGGKETGRIVSKLLLWSPVVRSCVVCHVLSEGCEHAGGVVESDVVLVEQVDAGEEEARLVGVRGVVRAVHDRLHDLPKLPATSNGNKVRAERGFNGVGFCSFLCGCITRQNSGLTHCTVEKLDTLVMSIKKFHRSLKFYVYQIWNHTGWTSCSTIITWRPAASEAALSRPRTSPVGTRRR